MIDHRASGVLGTGVASAVMDTGVASGIPGVLVEQREDFQGSKYWLGL